MCHCTWLLSVDFRDWTQVPGLSRHILHRQSHLPSLETAFLRELTELDKYAINFSSNLQWMTSLSIHPSEDHMIERPHYHCKYPRRDWRILYSWDALKKGMVVFGILRDLVSQINHDCQSCSSTLPPLPPEILVHGQKKQNCKWRCKLKSVHFSPALASLKLGSRGLGTFKVESGHSDRWLAAWEQDASFTTETHQPF